MHRKTLAVGILTIIIGVMLVSLASSPLSAHWKSINVSNSPKSELIVNRNFEVAQESIVKIQFHLEKGDNITVNAAISEPGTNRQVGAKIAFVLRDDTQVYESFGETGKVSLHWTAPNSGNYSLNFDNSKDSAAKEGIVMVTKYWRVTDHFVILVNTPLISHSFVWVGMFVCAGGAAIVILALRRKTGGLASNERTTATSS
jgi:hypothetical protein